MPRLPFSVIARLGGSSRFWRGRTTARQLWFRLTRRVFLLRESIYNTKVSASGIRYLARQTVFPALVAALSVVALHFIEKGWADFVADLGLIHTAFGKAITRPINGGSYSVLLQSVAAVTGVFLALYFTALSTVAATVYTAVPHDIRQLIVRDRLGSVYVRAAAYLTALSVFLLAAQASGASPYHLALFVIVLVSAFTIFSFIQLGQRAFYLADPTVLVDLPAAEFNRRFRNSTVDGWFWADPSFQEHYRRQAASSLGVIDSLLLISRKQQHLHGDPQDRLLLRVVALLQVYLKDKGMVPTKSRWFGERYEHKQWFLTESTAIDMATQTDTALSPETIPDHGWVESQLLDSAIGCIREALSEQRYSDTYAMLQKLPGVWDAFGANWFADEGSRWADNVTGVVIDAVAKSDPATTPPEAMRFLIGMADMAAFLPMSLELGLYKRITEIDARDLRTRISDADFGAAATPYTFGLPQSVCDELERIREGIQFERAADTPVHTPGWYVADVALNTFAWTVQAQFEASLAHAERWYPTISDRLTAAHAHEAAGAVLSRGLELAWKLGQHREKIETALTQLGADMVLGDLARPTWDGEVVDKRIERFRREVLKRMAKSIFDLAPKEMERDIPDYLGQAVHRSGEACFEALAQNDPELFRQLFGPYFFGVFAVIERLRPQVADWSDIGTALTWMTEPLIDLIDLSGYALIFSEYHANQTLWDECRDIWNAYLDGEDGKTRLRIISAGTSHQQRLFAISPRATLRTRREMFLSQLLSQLTRRPGRHQFAEGEVEHPSALIRRIAPSNGMGMMFLDASDVFIARFLMMLQGADGIDFGLADGKASELRDIDDTHDEAEAAEE